MSYQLVIAEKPSVARSIAGVIGADKKQDGYMEGNGYMVSWCIGHLVSLADAGTYDERFKKWRYDDLPILPQQWQYIIPDDKKKQFDTLRSLMERPDVTGLVCATDAGREGELIFRFVYQMAGCKKPFQRLWISSMEDAAIKDGFAHLKPGTDYDNLYQSALCRAQADWLVGINATRLFSILYHKTLTVGRVQTPTLKMLVDREAKISSFQKEKYHIVQIAAGGMEAASERMGNADDAKALKSACETAQAVCVSVTREKTTEQPPRLYDLTTLQREANRLFGFTAKQTLDYAQQLYEKKLLTYPRTDSQYLTDDMLPTAESLVSGLWPLLPFATGLDLSPQFGRVLNSKKVSDHHANVHRAELQHDRRHDEQRPVYGGTGSKGKSRGTDFPFGCGRGNQGGGQKAQADPKDNAETKEAVHPGAACRRQGGAEKEAPGAGKIKRNGGMRNVFHHGRRKPDLSVPQRRPPQDGGKSPGSTAGHGQGNGGAGLPDRK